MSAIEVQDAWVKFNIKFVDQTFTVRKAIIGMGHKLVRMREAFSPQTQKDGQSTLFWALKGVSLEVKPGEVVGITGHNGSGKSTLLKLMAGIYHPDRGAVHVHGKIGTLLSLGGGFDDELTGWENIHINGIYLGLTHREIQERAQQIVEFAELGEFIHAPVKTYSSGMRSRLGFSIAIHINPDILLIDEVLETGDSHFRQKAGNLLDRFKEQNKTIVIVSHTHKVIRECSRAVLMDHGKVAADGDPETVLKEYVARMDKSTPGN